MNVAPALTRLGDLLEVQNGYAFDSKLFSPISGIPLIRIRDLRSGSSTETRYDGDFDPKYLVRAGDLLIGMDGEFACYQWTGEPALLNQRVCRLQDFTTELLPRYLFYGINEQLKEIEDATGYTTVKHLSSKSVLDIEMPIPTLPKQQWIVGILDEAFAAIATARANAEQNLRNAREVFEGHLRSVFAGRNEGWEKKRLSTLCEDITVGYVGPMATQYKERGTPFLRSQNIRPFEVSLENVVFIDDSFHRLLAKSRLRPGDVAIVRTGFPGTAAVVPSELPDSNCADLVIVRPGREINPHYLAAFFNSAFGKGLVAGKLVGAAQRHFNVSAAKEVMLNVPPMPVQQEVVAMVHSLLAETERLASIHQRKLAALDSLKQSLLHQAFTGAL